MFEKATDKKDIGGLALSLGIRDEEVDFFGRYMAKIDYHILNRLQDKPDGKYIDVTAVTPTPFGEGKTVTTIGLGMALNKLGFKTVNTLREPSMGPVLVSRAVEQVVASLPSSRWSRSTCTSRVTSMQ